MKTLFVNKIETYDGTQLAPLGNYLRFGLLGDSCWSWVGPCQVSFSEMVDGEDLRAQERICGDQMLHFVFEIFDQTLAVGVLLQRLFADHVRGLILERTNGEVQLLRRGDDLYLDEKKLSISIATRSVNSVLVHFAVNVVNEGTPVPTCALNDWGLDPQSLAVELLKQIQAEYVSILEATRKVRTV